MKTSSWSLSSVLSLLCRLVGVLPSLVMIALGVYFLTERAPVVATGVATGPGIEVEGLGRVVMGARYHKERDCTGSGTKRSCHTDYKRTAVYGQSTISLLRDDGEIVTFTAAVPSAKDRSFVDYSTKDGEVVRLVRPGDRLTVVEGWMGVSLTAQSPEALASDRWNTGLQLLLFGVGSALAVLRFIARGFVGPLRSMLSERWGRRAPVVRSSAFVVGSVGAEPVQ